MGGGELRQTAIGGAGILAVALVVPAGFAAWGFLKDRLDDEPSGPTVTTTLPVWLEVGTNHGIDDCEHGRAFAESGTGMGVYMQPFEQAQYADGYIRGWEAAGCSVPPVER